MKEGWEIKKLGEVCDIICGQDYKSVKDDNGKYPIYGTGGIMGYASQYRCPANCVIIGRKGNINNPIYVETEFWNVDTAFGVVPKSEIIHPKFFYLFCKDYDFTKHDVSVTIPSLRRTDIIKIDVPIPPIAEQEKIVAELDCLSGIIEKKKQQLKEYDALAQSIFYEMFGNPVDNEKGWEVNVIGNIANFYNGAAHEGEILENGKYHVVNSKFISSNGEVRKYCDLQIFPLYKNDIVMVMSDVPNGKALAKCYIIEDNDIYTLNQRICAFRNYELVPIFLYYCLNRNPYYLSFDNGNSQTNLRKKDVLNCPIIIPPLALQQEFASKIEAIEKQKALIKKSIEEIETLFNSRMNEYFN